VIDRFFSFAAIGSNLIMMSAAFAGVPHVPHTNIDFSLPIFVAGIIATAVFVWSIAKYDASRTAKISKTELRMQMLVEEMEKRHAAIEESQRRSEALLVESQELLRSAMKILERLGKPER